MKRKFSFTISLAIFAVVCVFGWVSLPERVGGQNQIGKQSKISRKKPSNRKNQATIPDLVAYELFLRTVGAGNARNLVERVGLDNENTERIVSEAKGLKEDLERLDIFVRDIKNDKTKPGLEKKRLLEKAQEKKETNISRVVEQFLPDSLREENRRKFQQFIETEVKPEIQVLPAKRKNSIKSDLTEVAFLKTANSFAGAQNGGNLYLYSAAWQAEMNVFGSGALSEEYASNTSYRITVTVTSPGGRSNTTVSDWSYATALSDTGLSVGVEDRTYSIQADFEEQSGYYDEYGNFIGTGISFVGSSTSTVTVAPTIALLGATVIPAQFFVSGNPATVNPGTGVVSATISATQSVPDGTTIEMDFYETINSTAVGYSVQAGTSSGYPSFPTGNRQIRRIVNNSGEITTYGNLFTINFSGTSSNTGSVTNTLRINRILAVANGGNGGVQGENSQTPAVFVVSAQPTPTPSPSPSPSATPGGTLGGGPRGTGAGNNQCPPPGQGTINYINGVEQPDPCTSPIILDIDGDGFDLTSRENGVHFDLNANGHKEKLSWTAADSDDAWLVLDRNENHRIDDGTELFGDISEQPAGQNPRQGFASLGMFDAAARGGNGDGKITRSDLIFKKLRLWRDRNHNGIAEVEELSRLPALDVVAIDLDYRESNRTDAHGNRFKYRAKVRDGQNAQVGRWAWDVFLVARSQ